MSEKDRDSLTSSDPPIEKAGKEIFNREPGMSPTDVFLTDVFNQLIELLTILNRKGYVISLETHYPKRYATLEANVIRIEICGRFKLETSSGIEEIFLRINTHNPDYDNQPTILASPASGSNGRTYIIHNPANYLEWMDALQDNRLKLVKQYPLLKDTLDITQISFNTDFVDMVKSVANLPDAQQVTRFRGFKLIPTREGPTG